MPQGDRKRSRARRRKIRLALPDGHLQEPIRELFHQAAYDLVGYDEESRNYRPEITAHREIEIKVLRPQEIPLLVAQGAHHLGVTGWDLLQESPASVEELLNLECGHAEVVFAIPEETQNKRKIYNVDDFLRRFWKKGPRVATEYIRLTERRILRSNFYRRKREQKQAGRPAWILPWMSRRIQSKVKIILSYGATEAKPPDDADAIVDNVGTGQTLKENHLVSLETLLESTAWLIANKKCLEKRWILNAVIRLAMALDGAVTGRHFLHMFANVRRWSRKALRASGLPKLAQKEVTVVESHSGLWARIDLLLKRSDYQGALHGFHTLRGKDIVAVRPEGVVWPSKVVEERRAPYLRLVKDADRK